MKLNLGSGIFPFPLERDHIPNPEHLEPLPDHVFEPGWVNVDKHPAAGVQECIDLFRFPWVRSSNGNPFEDDCADLIWAGHILEHVPHQVRVRNGLPGPLARRYGEMIEELDGFFVFMAECWRILKPDGLIHIRFPYATSYASLSDPTHTRYMTPGSFSYLGARDENTPFDYNVGCHFELHEPFTFRLRTPLLEQRHYYTPEGLSEQVRANYALADEVRLTLRAVKGESQ